MTATIRNRGDLMVPSAKVEFWLVNPSLGFDTRFATKLGVSADRVHAHGASEVSLDYVVPPSLSGHRCLFARVFSFSPLDLPIDDFALDPRIDRHIGQLNLSIVGQATSFTLDWIHHRNAVERLELVPMTTPMQRALRLESVTALTVVGARHWKEASGGLTFETAPGEGAAISIEQQGGGPRAREHRPRGGAARPASGAHETGAGRAPSPRAGPRQRLPLPRALRGVPRDDRAIGADEGRARPAAGRTQGRPGRGAQRVRRSTATGEPLGGIGLLVRGPRRRARKG